MTEKQFDERMQTIEREAGRLRERADAYRDQELARLLVECEWSQERIARKMGRRQSWVSQRLCFGRFLAFITTGDNSQKQPENLTERRFRALWAKTAKGPEAERFRDVLRLLDTESQPQSYRNLTCKPGIRAALQESLSDGRWHNVKQLMAAVCESVSEANAVSVSGALRSLQKRPPAGHVVEAKHCGRVHQYRLRKGAGVGRDLPLAEVTRIVDRITPVIEELKQWGGASEYQQNPGALRRLAAQLEQAISSLMEPAAT